MVGGIPEQVHAGIQVARGAGELEVCRVGTGLAITGQHHPVVCDWSILIAAGITAVRHCPAHSAYAVIGDAVAAEKKILDVAECGYRVAAGHLQNLFTRHGAPPELCRSSGNRSKPGYADHPR